MPEPVPASFQQIQHFVVLMLENRSFDHLFGKIPSVAGLTGNEFNYDDPNSPVVGQKRLVQRADRFDMPFDPPHEFEDVQFQLYGPIPGQENKPNPPNNPAALNGFVLRALATGPHLYAEDAARVMSYFTPDQLPALSTLAQEFAVFNTWHSSLPGPTWPNRFFVHAATSGGLNYSPSELQIIGGFEFKGGTIYDRLGAQGWRIYHDGLPQTIGITDLRWNYLKQIHNPFESNFRPIAEFVADIAANDLPRYTFIEPNYDTGNNYLGGDSMHPLNDIRKGDGLVKQVYEIIRNSAYWSSTMLIITFDEHGGFFDHVPPPGTVATGDDHRYASDDYPFAYDLLGIRVPAVVASAYTQKGTIIGTPGDGNPFDHTSILATLEKRFNLQPLTARDAEAQTLDVAVNLEAPRLTDAEAPMVLPNLAPDAAAAAVVSLTPGARNYAPLSDNQRSFLALALACDLETTDVSQHSVIRAQYQNITTQKQAADYISSVVQKVQPAPAGNNEP